MHVLEVLADVALDVIVVANPEEAEKIMSDKFLRYNTEFLKFVL